MKSRCLFLGVFIISCLQVFAQKDVTDSLHNALKIEREDTNKVKTLEALSERLWRTGNYDSSMAYANSGMAIAYKLGFKDGIATAFKNLGDVYFYLGNYSRAMLCDDSALILYKQAGDQKGIAITLSNTGLLYQNNGNYPKALEYAFNALDINRKIKNDNGMATNLSNIGVVNFEQGNYSKALEFDFKALALYKKIDKKSGIATCYGNIGTNYFELDSANKALEYHFKALEINQKIGNKHGIALNLGNIGNGYSAHAKSLLSKHQAGGIDSLCKRALEYNLKALIIDREIGDKEGMANIYGNVGNVYTMQKNYNLAKAYLDSALNLSKSIGQKEDMLNTYKYFTELDSAKGNFENAFADYRIFDIYRDSLEDEATTKKVLELQMSYDFKSKTDSAKAAQEKLNLIAAKKSQQQNVILYSFISGFVVMLVLALLIFIGYRQKQKSNIIITQQKELVEGKNKEILDSITYAKRLQEAILPPISLVKKIFPESFVLYQPKDIVAGDFYWVEHVGDNLFLAAADCTGHGVPGALVSVICSNALNRTVKEFHITESGKILDKVCELVLETFEKSENNVQDGMDISLCCVNKKTNEFHWSGAYNPLWYIQKGEMHELPGDKQPIGRYDNTQPFITYTRKLQKGDILYLFTDGYADQFGGPRGKKFKYKQLQEILLANAFMSMEEQKTMLEGHLDDWKGSLEQVDDILIMGVRV